MTDCEPVINVLIVAAFSLDRSIPASGRSAFSQGVTT